jgi:hypothetical protein
MISSPKYEKANILKNDTIFPGVESAKANKLLLKMENCRPIVSKIKYKNYLKTSGKPHFE